MSADQGSARELLAEAARLGGRYLEGLAERAVAPRPADLARLAELGGPFPAGPADPRQVLALLDRAGAPATVATAGGRFFGFVIGGSQPAALAANVLAAAWDQNAGLAIASPVGAHLEEVASAWLLEALDLPRASAVGFVTGATMANLAGLAAARHALLARRGHDVERRGLFGAPSFPVLVGEEAHASLEKALVLLGFGLDNLHRVPTDEQGRMRPEAFPRLDEPALVCLQAGNVNTGALDPAAELCARAQESGSWVHVDGAFGLWARAARSRAPLARGYELADSWAVDAHKWLNVPYDSGMAIVRERAALERALAADAPYLLTAHAPRPPSATTPELSRRARGIEVWAALRALGRSGLEALVERTCAFARRFAAGLAEAGHEVRNDVVLNQVLVSFGDEAATERTIAAIQRDGTCWCGGTTWHGRRSMRLSVSSWATTEDDVERSLAAILRCAAGATGRG